MEKNRSYYRDLVMYELRTRKGNFSAWQTIVRMTNNPAILAKQELLFDRMLDGHYLIRVTEAVMDTMKRVVDFTFVQRIESEDEQRKIQELTKRYYPQWA